MDTSLVFPNPGPYEHIIKEGDLVFDIGACIGQMTEFYLSRGARVIAVEPESDDVEKLTERFGDNDKVTIVPKAVGEKNGSSHLYIYKGANSISTFVPTIWWGQDSAFKGTQGTGWEEVEMITLDSLIEEYGSPQFIKLDIEGYESFALQGLSQPVPFVQFEMCGATIKSGQVRECFERILSICPTATFNYTLCEGPGFRIGPDVFRHWTTAEEVMKKIDEEVEEWSLFWGNGLANMMGNNLD